MLEGEISMNNVYELAQVIKVGGNYYVLARHKGKVQQSQLVGEKQAIRFAQMHISMINWSRKKDGNKARQIRQGY